MEHNNKNEKIIETYYNNNQLYIFANLIFFINVMSYVKKVALRLI